MFYLPLVTVGYSAVVDFNMVNHSKHDKVHRVVSGKILQF